MFQQLLWSDFLVYILNVCLCSDHNWWLMMYLKFAFQVINIITFFLLKFLNESEDLIYNHDNITYICDIMRFNMKSFNLYNMMILKMQNVLKTWWESDTKNKFSYFFNVNSFAEHNFEKFANFFIKFMIFE